MRSRSRLSFELRVRCDWLLRELRVGLQELLLPRRCPACGGASGAVLEPCLSCRRELRPASRAGRCPLCTGPGPRCPDCATFRGPLARIRAGFVYAGTGGALVRRFKLERDPAALGLLGRRLAAGLPRYDPGYRRHVVVPVPLARGRRRQRGFNQAEELGRFVATRLGIPMRAEALCRLRETEPQGSEATLDREANLCGAFGPGRAPARLRGARVLLVDDVVTSGATLRACAAVLREDCGVREVEALVACTARQVGAGR